MIGLWIGLGIGTMAGVKLGEYWTVIRFGNAQRRALWRQIREGK